MSFWLRNLALVSACSFALIGCSGNSSSVKDPGDDEEEVVKLNGVLDAYTSSAIVVSVGLDYQGQPARSATTGKFDGKAAITSDLGKYEVDLVESLVGQPVLLIATNESDTAQYICQLVDGCGEINHEKLVDLDEGYQVRAGVAEAAEGMQIQINWITDLASSFATTDYIDEDGDEELETNKRGFYSEYSIELANRRLNELFNIDDVISTQPIAPADASDLIDLSSSQMVQAFYYGALLSSIQQIQQDRERDYLAVINDITAEFLSLDGQFYERDNASSRITLYEIFSAAEQVLTENIEKLDANGATINQEARMAAEDLSEKAAQMRNGRLTEVVISVPSSLSEWKGNIEEAKTFVDDLNERLLNFKGEDPTKASFIEGEYSDRLESYFDGHTEYYDAVVPNINVALNRLMDALLYYASCFNDNDGEAGCNADLFKSGFSWNADDETLDIDGTLTLSYKPDTNNDESRETFTTFDVLLDGSLEVAESDQSDAVTLTWNSDKNSIGFDQDPTIRFIYEEEYKTLQTFSVVEPSTIEISWPAVVFSPAVVNGEEVDLLVLIETGLVAVKDPYDSSFEARYNPSGLNFWVRSDGEIKDTATQDGEEVLFRDQTAFASDLITVNPSLFYPDTKWPEFSNFFAKRPEAELVQEVDELLELYLSSSTVNIGTADDPNNVTVNYIEFDVEGAGVTRHRLFPPEGDNTGLQICSLVDNDAAPADREVDICSDVARLTGEIDMEAYIDILNTSNQFDLQAVPAHGVYRIDSSAIKNGDGSVKDLPTDSVIGPFSGALESTYELGIDSFSFTANNALIEGEGSDKRLKPTLVQGALIRKNKDFFEASLTFAYDYDFLVSNVAVGERAQSLTVGYGISYDNDSNFVIEVGSLVVFRAGVTLFGDEQNVGLAATSRAEYEVGDEEGSCGAYNRNDNVSTGQCEAVAYLSFRGVLMATVREERPGVYIVRFVDGTWTMLGNG